MSRQQQKQLGPGSFLGSIVYKVCPQTHGLLKRIDSLYAHPEDAYFSQSPMQPAVLLLRLRIYASYENVVKREENVVISDGFLKWRVRRISFPLPCSVLVSSSFHLHLLIIEKTHDAPKHARREPFTNKICQKRTAPLHTRARTHAHKYILLFDADKCVAQPKFFVARRVS